MTYDEIEFIIQCCKLEIRRLSLQLSLAMTLDEKAEIELKIKKKKKNLNNTKWSRISNA